MFEEITLLLQLGAAFAELCQLGEFVLGETLGLAAFDLVPADPDTQNPGTDAQLTGDLSDGFVSLSHDFRALVSGLCERVWGGYSIAHVMIGASSADTGSAFTAKSPSATTARPTVSGLIGRKAVIAIVEIRDADAVLDVSAVLADEGIDALEITLRTPVALQAIELAAGRADLPVGAGTIIRPSDADRAAACGAQFLVSPGYDPTLVDHVNGLGVPLLPGVITPSEVQTALRNRFTEMKLFPAELFGGIKLVNALAPLFPDVAFVPSGGVGLDNADVYLRHPSVAAVGGSLIAPADLINRQAWNEIAGRARSVRNLRTQLAD